MTIGAISISSARIVAAIALSFSILSPVAAADWSYTVLAAPSAYTAQFGTRVWYGKGKTGKDLFNGTGTLLLSRLTYDGSTIFAGEGFSRFDLNTGWFLKGYGGGGALWDGRLKDEDFPPVVAPYSATLSPIKNSSMLYGSVDGGVKFLRGPDFHFGAFIGYHFMRQTVSAYGCTQIASHPGICAPTPIPDFVKGITQNNDWHSLRVGMEAAVELNRRLKLTVDAAYLPYVYLTGTDAHWLRIGTSPGDFTGPVPEDGTGWGYQVDGFLSYQLNDLFSIGVGGRYWHMRTKGHTHFENHVVGVNAGPQVLNWKTDNFGVFFQSSVKLGPHPIFGAN